MPMSCGDCPLWPLAIATAAFACAVALAAAPPPADEPAERTTVVSEHVLLVARPLVSVYSPLDAGASAHLLDDTNAVPDFASCAHFNGSVYCAGAWSVNAWRFGYDGSPLPFGPGLNREVVWPGNGRLAGIDDEWLVLCGDWRYEQPQICQVLHIDANHWTDVESATCGKQSAVAAHSGSVFVAGGWCNDSASAEVWSLSLSQTAAGNVTSQWRRHPDLNKARDLFAMASHKGYLYACGGNDIIYAMADCERWQEGMDSWQSVAPLPRPLARLLMLSVDGHLVAMGGDDPRDVYDYDGTGDAWSRLHDTPATYSFFGAAVVPAL